MFSKYLVLLMLLCVLFRYLEMLEILDVEEKLRLLLTFVRFNCRTFCFVFWERVVCG